MVFGMVRFHPHPLIIINLKYGGLKMKYKQYKDLTLNERINAKSFGFWRLPNKEGFLMTMIDNALSFKREDFYDYTMHTTFEHYDAPKL